MVSRGNVDDLIDSFSNTTIQPTNKVEPSASFTNLEDLVVPVESKDGRSSSVEDILGWNAEGKPAPETEKKKHSPTFVFCLCIMTTIKVHHNVFAQAVPISI